MFEDEAHRLGNHLRRHGWVDDSGYWYHEMTGGLRLQEALDRQEQWDRQLAAQVAATAPPPVPPADRLYERAQAALAMLQELEIELGNARPDLAEFGRQVVDSVSMVGRLIDQLDAEASADEDEEPEEGHGWRMEP